MKSEHKAFFLGPQAENEAWVLAEMQSILEHWFRWRRSLFPEDETAIPENERRSQSFLMSRKRLSEGLEELNYLLKDELPTFPPRYIGHMVSELALPAIFGHLVTLLHNPNNTTSEASKVGTFIENELVEMLATMVGYTPEKAAGHITSGGTVANFEAIWRARFRLDHWLALALHLAEAHGRTLPLFEAAHMGWERFNMLVAEHNVTDEDLRACSSVAANPLEIAERMSATYDIPWRGPVVLVPQNKHFSWQKGVSVFGFGEDAFRSVSLDRQGKVDIGDLKKQILRSKEENRPILMIVSVAGTTETAEIDPIHEVRDHLDTLRNEEGLDIWHHVDAAYGGFMCSMLRGGKTTVLKPESQLALEAIGSAHSVTIDPHKLGYVPYACGALLVRSARAYTVSTFKAPYLDREKAPDKWSTTLEGSRPATGAAATWLTGKTLGFDAQGLGAVISDTILAVRRFKSFLTENLPSFRPLEPTDTNVLCFCLAEEGETLSETNRKTLALYNAIHDCAEFSVSKTVFSVETHGAMIDYHLSGHRGVRDDDALMLLRCVFMNPFWGEQSVAEPLTREFCELLRRWYTDQP
jgi:tyrosine decarboxylase